MPTKTTYDQTETSSKTKKITRTSPYRRLPKCRSPKLSLSIPSRKHKFKEDLTVKRPAAYVIRVSSKREKENSAAGPSEESSSGGMSVLKNNMISRTNMKQQLQRQQLEQLERKEAEQKILATSAPVRSSTAIEVPRTVEVAAVEVPRQIFMVETKLANPTPYHVRQSQQRQVQHFLTHNQRVRGVIPVSPPPQINSCDPSPNSPLSATASSAASPVELEEFWDDFSKLETTVQTDLNILDPFHFPNTHPDNTGQIDIYAATHPGAKVSTSCPAELANVKEEEEEDVECITEAEVIALAKDRQKKDNHNMIERKRRFNINDRIKELGTLLPKSSDPHFDLVKDLKHNKGTILKASVDYVRCLKKETDKIPFLEEKCRQSEQINKKLLLRIQELELKLKSNGIAMRQSTWQPSNEADIEALIKSEPFANDIILQSASSVSIVGSNSQCVPNYIITNQDAVTSASAENIMNQYSAFQLLTVKQEPHITPAESPNSCIDSVSNASSVINFGLEEIMMDDDQPVTGDPMLSAHDAFSPENMDFMA